MKCDKGRLWYKHEMCYVIIGCLQQDHKFNDLLTIDTQDIIDHNGLVENVNVVDSWLWGFAARLLPSFCWGVSDWSWVLLSLRFRCLLLIPLLGCLRLKLSSLGCKVLQPPIFPLLGCVRLTLNSLCCSVWFRAKRGSTRAQPGLCSFSPFLLCDSA